MCLMCRREVESASFHFIFFWISKHNLIESNLITTIQTMAGQAETQGKDQTKVAQTSENEKSGDAKTLYAGRTVEYEFGGPNGALALMVWSHCNLVYFW